MQRLLYTVMLLIVVHFASAQRGGESTYDFLNLTNSARVAALGGTNVSLVNNDLNLSYHNPSLLNDTMNNSIVLNYVPYMADINYGYVAFARHYENLGTFSLGVHNINYGDFTRTNEIGETMGVASAAEYAFILTYARQLSPHISMGMSINQSPWSS